MKNGPCFRVVFHWLEIGNENITFADELEFDPAEVESVYQENKQENNSL